MKFGVMFANTGPFATPEGAAAIAEAAEGAGFESIWTVEHVVVPVGYQSRYPYDESGKMPGGEKVDIPDPLVWLAYVAARTSTLKLGTGILIANQRNPLVLAKEVATLDRLSGGRVLFGVGVGWLREEFEALGVPFEGRGRRLDEQIEVMRTLWAEEQAEFHGEFTSFKPVVSRPRPTNGAVPIIIGGHSDAAARRAGRLGDGFFPGKGSNERLRELIGIMRDAARAAGRDPDAIELTTGGQAAFAADPVAALRELEQDLGVDRVVIPPLAFDPDGIGPALERFGNDVIARVS
ncbi:MAG: LLM class F420-dependent oxidoreductase [Acidimicrobiales bacterium]